MVNDRYIPDNGFSENFLHTEGRLNRLRYFKRQLCLALFLCIAVIFAYVIFTDDWGNETDELYIAVGIMTLGQSILSYFLDVRRLHDLGKDNNFAIVLLILGIITAVFTESAITYMTGVLGLVGTLYLLFKQGVTDPNEYGPDPLGATINDNYQDQDNYHDDVDIPDFSSRNSPTDAHDDGEDSQNSTDDDDFDF